LGKQCPVRIDLKLHADVTTALVDPIAVLIHIMATTQFSGESMMSGPRGPLIIGDREMIFARRNVLFMMAVVGSLGLAGPSRAADTLVKVSLWDKGDMSMDMLGKGMPMGMAMHSGTDMGMAMMGITIDTETVPAGTVTFEVTNDSKGMIHEMVISPVGDTSVALPYLTEEEKVDEDAAGHLGEVAELDPGKGGALKIDLTPGKYILYCNIPGHYVLGMWTIVTVTG
jgi:uncharacterized cupredoxin-like copper-binding protein